MGHAPYVYIYLDHIYTSIHVSMRYGSCPINTYTLTMYTWVYMYVYIYTYIWMCTLGAEFKSASIPSISRVMAFVRYRYVVVVSPAFLKEFQKEKKNFSWLSQVSSQLKWLSKMAIPLTCENFLSEIVASLLTWVPWLLYRNYAGRPKNRGLRWPKLSAIDVTEKAICDRKSNLWAFSLGSRMAIGGQIHIHALGAHTQTLTIATISRFLSFRSIFPHENVNNVPVVIWLTPGTLLTFSKVCSLVNLHGVCSNRLTLEHFYMRAGTPFDRKKPPPKPPKGVFPFWHVSIGKGGRKRDLMKQDFWAFLPEGTQAFAPKIAQNSRESGDYYIK